VKHRQYSTASPAQGHTKASKQHWTSAAEPENCSALELSSTPLAAPSMLICYVISCIATGPYLHTQAIQKLKTGAAGVLLWDPVERHPCLTPALGQPCGSEGNVCHSFQHLKYVTSTLHHSTITSLVAQQPPMTSTCHALQPRFV